MTSPWPTVPLGDLAELVRDRVHPSTRPDAPYLGLEHVGVGTLTLLGTGSAAEVTSHAFAFRAGDIVFGRLRPYFRKVVRPDFDGLCTTEAWVVRPRGGTDARFLFYLLADPAFVDHCTRSSQGTRMPRAKWSFAAALPTPLPSEAEQRRNGGLLGLLDDKIATNRAMNATLQELLAVAFRRWFVDDPAVAGWPESTLGAFAEHHRDLVEPGDAADDVPYVGLADITKRSMALETWGRAGDATSTKHRFRRGDVLFGKLRPYFKKVVVAPVDGVCSSDILVVRPREPGWSAYVLGWLTRFEAAMVPLVQRVLCNLDENRTLAALRDALLPRLLSGEVRVPAGAAFEETRP